MKTVRRSDLVRAPKRGVARSLVRKGPRTEQGTGVVRTVPQTPEPGRCSCCNAILEYETSRRVERRVPFDLPGALLVADTMCPACLHARDREYYGRVHLRAGRFLSSHEHEMRARIHMIEARARNTQPDGRILALVRRSDGLEVRTTSQRLAHRIAQELVKAFRGRATYDWSDRAGELLATWSRDDAGR
jgi:NMD protein affecting ribosome stability and mRNA decay